MTMIEGVGDEVVQCLVAFLAVAVASIAWWSTNARPDRYQTVLVMRSRANHPVTVSILTRPNNVSNSRAVPALAPPPEPTAARNIVPESRRIRDNRVIPLQEMDSIVDADMAMLDNNRLHFYRRIDSPPANPTTTEPANEVAESTEQQEPASNAQIREMDSIVNAMEADVTTSCDFFRRSGESNCKPSVAKPSNIQGPLTDSTEQNASSDSTLEDSEDSNDDSVQRDERNIMIKLKYLNDTLKEVEGNLDEPLIDFKRRHFSAELGAERRVRLIFRGRVLGEERATLAACGLHHRAVVHCLVHPVRARDELIEPTDELNAATHELVSEGGTADRAWDLESVLMTFISIVLTVVWFFRCEYSNMFTASASVALFGLTVFYSVAIFGLYLSDTFYADRRPAAAPTPPVPNN